ncbi:MAG: ComF family protein [Planctomycetota bacterium]
MNSTAYTVLFTRANLSAGRMRRLISASTDATLDLLFPPHCVSCGTPLPPVVNKALCLPCAEKIRWIANNRCRRCGDAVGLGSDVVADCPSCRAHPPVFVKAICSVALYAEGPLRDLILSLKFGRKLHLARPMGELLAARIQTTRLANENTILAPIPLTRQSTLQRGFNHTEELAQCVGRQLHLKVESRLLRKIRGTAPQAMLTREQRRNNLKGAFACNLKIAARCKDAQVLLIDDVITTCSTVSECARTLTDAGIGEVRAASVARG